jgi:glyoxylase-like metal-dependent hydrolase (beta-lactamase superfamily II)
LTLPAAWAHNPRVNTTSTAVAAPASAQTIGAAQVVPFLHPQGCRTYLLADPVSKQALVIDPHLDLTTAIAAYIAAAGWTLRFVVDTHTHADHPSGAAALAAQFGAVRVAHPIACHRGVTRTPADGEVLQLGGLAVRVRYAPGHTPDHLALQIDGALFTGDSLFIGAVARTDFLGGDAGKLFDSLQALLADLPDATVVYPGHDYHGGVASTLGVERAGNAWLHLTDRDAFIRGLTANPPPKPANMDALLQLNRDGETIPETIRAADAVARVAAGGVRSVVDVRTLAEVEAERLEGAVHVPMDRLAEEAERVRALPAPRLLLCRTGRRAVAARTTLAGLGIGGLTVMEGGIEAYRAAGGSTVVGKQHMSLERQVRIAAGSLAAVGGLLALTVHVAFAALPLLIGGGLVYSGITDWCGMGMLLAKMPWNRGKGGSSGSGSSSQPAAACAASAPPSCSAPLPPR